MYRIISRKKPIMAYKAFEMDFRCRGFQYEVGKEYHINGDISSCVKGFHACENLIDVFEFYPLGKSRIAEVELWGNIDESYQSLSDTVKLCASDIRIVREISLDDYINDNYDGTIISSDSFNRKIYMPDDNIDVFVSEEYTSVTTDGSRDRIYSNSAKAVISSLGPYTKILSAGAYSNISLGSLFCYVYSNGEYSNISSNGIASCIYSDGDHSCITLNGKNSRVVSKGKESVVACFGAYSIAKAEEGSWITLTEWGKGLDGKYYQKHIKTEYVDGERIKADTWYRLKGGEFIE